MRQFHFNLTSNIIIIIARTEKSEFYFCDAWRFVKWCRRLYIYCSARAHFGCRSNEKSERKCVRPADDAVTAINFRLISFSSFICLVKADMSLYVRYIKTHSAASVLLLMFFPRTRRRPFATILYNIFETMHRWAICVDTFFLSLSLSLPVSLSRFVYCLHHNLILYNTRNR